MSSATSKCLQILRIWFQVSRMGHWPISWHLFFSLLVNPRIISSQFDVVGKHGKPLCIFSTGDASRRFSLRALLSLGLCSGGLARTWRGRESRWWIYSPTIITSKAHLGFWNLKLNPKKSRFISYCLEIQHIVCDSFVQNITSKLLILTLETNVPRKWTFACQGDLKKRDVISSDARNSAPNLRFDGKSNKTLESFDIRDFVKKTIYICTYRKLHLCI